jgi:PRC-barrel domain
MLKKAKDILGFTLGAKDGEIGRVKDFYFDDQSWTVRYLVADTGKWLPQRKVLISPFAVKGFRDAESVVDVSLTRTQIKGSPSIDADAPVSRQFEQEYYKYYGWPLYWQGPGSMGTIGHAAAAAFPRRGNTASRNR